MFVTPLWEKFAGLATPAKAIFSNNSLFIKASISLAHNFMNRVSAQIDDRNLYNSAFACRYEYDHCVYYWGFDNKDG
jgi:hypothetical protein